VRARIDVSAGYLERIKSAALPNDVSGMQANRVALASLLAYSNTTHALVVAPAKQERGLLSLGIQTQSLPSGLRFAVLRLADVNAGIAKVAPHLSGSSLSSFLTSF
jgi:hypothetical protein